VSCNSELNSVSCLYVCNFYEAKYAGILQDDFKMVKNIVLVYFDLFYCLDTKEMNMI